MLATRATLLIGAVFGAVSAFVLNPNRKEARFPVAGGADGWHHDKTVLEQFYEYVKGERDVLEKRMGNRNSQPSFGKATMKIPKTKSRIKRSNPTSSNKEYIKKIKEEISKLEDLITILKEQKNVVNTLNDLNPVNNFNLTLFVKEFGDLKHYIKAFLVDKLDREINERRTIDKIVFEKLQEQQLLIKKISNRIPEENRKEGNADVINDIEKELKILEAHLLKIAGKDDSKEEEILKGTGKMRKSNFDDAVLKESNHKKEIIEKLMKKIELHKKKEKPKTLLEELLTEIGSESNNAENREINNDVEDRLKLLKEEIDNLQTVEEQPDDTESRKLEDVLKKLLNQHKPVVKKEPNLGGLLKKFLSNQQTLSTNPNINQTPKTFNLFNCKQIQETNDQNFGNYGYLDQNQLFQGPNQYYPSQQQYYGDYRQQYPDYSWKNYENYGLNEKINIAEIKNQILNLQTIISGMNNDREYMQKPENQYDLYNLNQQVNELKNNVNNFDENQNQVNNIFDKKMPANEGYNINNGNKARSNEKKPIGKAINHKIKRSTPKTLEDILNEELNNEEVDENSLENELDPDEDIDNKERSYYNSKTFKQTKKITVFDKIFDKILTKIVDKAQIAIPKVLRAIFDIKTIFGLNLNGYENYGVLGILPMLILKLVSTFNSFMYQLQQYPFFKNFLVPALIVLGVSGLVVFLIWWLQPSYKEIGYQNPAPYNDRYYSYPSYQQYQYSSNNYNRNAMFNRNMYYRNNK